VARFLEVLKEAKVERYGREFAGSIKVLRVGGCEGMCEEPGLLLLSIVVRERKAVRLRGYPSQ
jgi:hypothetical protein